MLLVLQANRTFAARLEQVPPITATLPSSSRQGAFFFFFCNFQNSACVSFHSVPLICAPVAGARF